MKATDSTTAPDFLAAHQAIVGKIARSFAHDDNDFDDLFQEICIGLWAIFDQIPTDVKESTYVYRVALNRAISWHRKRNSYLHHLTAFWRNTSRQHTTESQSKTDDQVELLYTAIRRLSESDRSLVLLFLDDLSSQEMSEVLGIPPPTVRKRVSRVKQKLADIVQQLEAEHDT